MSTGLLLGMCIIYFLHFSGASVPLTTPVFREQILRKNLDVSLVLVHLYYVPGLSGILYPGAAWTDPEFGNGRLQLYLFSALLMMGWLGWWVETRRIASGQIKLS